MALSCVCGGERFRLNIRKKLFPERIVKHCNSLLIEMVNTFKRHVDVAPGAV